MRRPADETVVLKLRERRPHREPRDPFPLHQFHFAWKESAHRIETARDRAGQFMSQSVLQQYASHRPILFSNVHRKTSLIVVVKNFSSVKKNRKEPLRTPSGTERNSRELVWISVRSS